MAQQGTAGAEEILVVGSTTSDDLTPDAGSAVVSTDVFVARFSHGGASRHNPLRFGGAGADMANAVAFGSQGEAYVVGSTRSGTISPVSKRFNSYTMAGDDAFLARVSPAGALEWFMYLGGDGDDVATGVTFESGAVYIVGRTSSQVFLRDPHLAQGVNDGFVAKMDVTDPANPTLAWSKRIGSQQPDVLAGVTVAGDGNLVVVGTSAGHIFGHGDTRVEHHGPEGVNDAVVVKLDPATGEGLWTTYLGGMEADLGSAIVRDPLVSGQVAVVGTTSSTDWSPVPPPGEANAFIAWLGTDGTTRKTRVGGGSQEEETLAAAVDTSGNVYVAGRTASADLSGPNAFDFTIEPQSGDPTFREGFVWAVPPEGPGWASYAGGAQYDDVAALSIRSGNRLVLAGQTHSGTGLFRITNYDPSMSTPPDGVLVALDARDITPPSTGMVFDGAQPNVDLQTQTERTSISANWTGLEEDVPGIVEYEWAIGTPADPVAVQDFTPLSNTQQKSATRTGLTLTVGERYIVTVRARNDVGFATVISSNGVLVTEPEGGPDGGMGGPDGGMGGPDGGPGGPDGGMGGSDGGPGGPGGGGGPGGPDEDIKQSPVGWGCASAGGVLMPVVLGLLVLVLLARRSRT
jgi:hypothetical protein